MGAVAAVGLALALSGCTTPQAAPGSETIAPSGAATSGAGANGAPSGTAVPGEGPGAGNAAGAADPARPETWTIGYAGVGPVVLGDASTAREEALAAFAPEPPAGACGLDFVTGPSGLRIGTAESAADGVTQIVVASAGAPAAAGVSPRTSDGIGLGSTIGQVTIAYPDARRTSVEGEALLTYAVSDGAGRSIVFGAWRTDDAIVVVQVGTDDRVTAEGCGVTA
ncbi:hypothetical protein LLS1_06740 [Leifsonia sp. LS1]|uniref:hypothetical protein n=1 Tax=Leifsonia sp. LS1 TaxID=2828483 RepID=UPI001CFC6A12|nr:hypothetical protein [Leifsonia sp. LS1]GIT79005.1 hypothetical protein LLS1_06740 [Leifsonia sp. LS1]